ncbi:Arabinoxylan arabinofuranohydrolase (plasmid) [Asticcacaulis sp. MM231]|uniref:glycoside hydrolase family 43 protein n=1 Tax=Asticcacaulis sp. MM231 TaxID=3157666 RepID=UPI0032D594B4
MTNQTRRQSLAILGGGAFALLANRASAAVAAPVPGNNPIITNAFTADPAPLVHNGRVYLYVGHDEAHGQQLFNMTEWLAYSSEDMKTWTSHGAIMKPTDFKWAVGDAWASQVTYTNGKFYLYATVQHDKSDNGKAVGVAVSDSPTGPFVDARGTALVGNTKTTPNGLRPWEDIDPTVFTDTDGTSWLAWGNGQCYLVKLKSNMIELDGEIHTFDLPDYTEGPWLHKRGELYYLTYAGMDKEKHAENIAYATSHAITGPWTYRGLITGTAQNSFTIHPGIIEFKNQWYLFYHKATLTINGEAGATGRRCVCLDYMYYNPDGTIQAVVQSEAGVSLPPKAL